MRKSAKFLLFFILSMYLGCTADDICSEETPTTPNLVISFADNRISDVAKPLNHLVVRNIEYDTIVWNAPADTIRIPLTTEFDKSTYAFTILKDSITYTNVYELVYTPEEVYVNRACGFKMIYTDLDANSIPNEDNTPSWAKNITVLNSIVEDEESAHITILH